MDTHRPRASHKGDHDRKRHAIWGMQSRCLRRTWDHALPGCFQSQQGDGEAFLLLMSNTDKIPPQNSSPSCLATGTSEGDEEC